MAPKAIPLPVPVEEPPEDPPKCPPKGSPAWMATFADIATLLMAFFVLILSFAEFNQPKFKLVSGSLKQAFGVQQRVPIVEQPKGTTILTLNFSPSPEVVITENMTQQTTDTSRPEVVADPQDTEDVTGAEGEGQKTQDTAEQADREAIEALADALRQALSPEGVDVETREGSVVLNFEDTEPRDLPDEMTEVADALEEAAEAGDTLANEVLLEGLTEELKELAEAAQAQADRASEADAAQRQAEIAEAELRVALREQLDQGLVTIEQREDRVVVTVGAGGAFPSGEAELTTAARDIMSQIAFAAMGDASDIVVTGHTDSVPLSGSSPFRDNWGLAAARASSVVRELQAASGIEPSRMTALSRGESMPIADNATPEGRERNRRIEIEFHY